MKLRMKIALMLVAALLSASGAHASDIGVSGSCNKTTEHDSTSWSSTRDACEKAGGAFYSFSGSSVMTPVQCFPISSGEYKCGDVNGAPVSPVTMMTVLQINSWSDFTCPNNLTPTIRLRSKEKRIEWTCEESR